jgi:hypothetical protein
MAKMLVDNFKVGKFKATKAYVKKSANGMV